MACDGVVVDESGFDIHEDGRGDRCIRGVGSLAVVIERSSIGIIERGMGCRGSRWDRRIEGRSSLGLTWVLCRDFGNDRGVTSSLLEYAGYELRELLSELGIVFSSVFDVCEEYLRLGISWDEGRLESAG
jgi:hypothetical protein